MTRYVAFLRGINVGGHTVKMDQLKKHFEELGFEKVETFIASGQVVFESDEKSRAKLEEKIEKALKAKLGYDVATFVRTDREVADIAAHNPFSKVTPKEGDRLHIGFLRDEPDAATRKAVLALATDEDRLHFHGRELYWLRRGPLLESTINTNELNKAFGKAPTSLRNANTLQRLATKYPPGKSDGTTKLAMSAKAAKAAKR